jgi:hypothetical protein
VCPEVGKFFFKEQGQMLNCGITERLRRIEIPQTAFATLVGITGGALSSYLNQQASPSASTPVDTNAFEQSDTLEEIEFYAQ